MEIRWFLHVARDAPFNDSRHGVGGRARGIVRGDGREAAGSGGKERKGIGAGICVCAVCVRYFVFVPAEFLYTHKHTHTQNMIIPRIRRACLYLRPY